MRPMKDYLAWARTNWSRSRNSAPPERTPDDVQEEPPLDPEQVKKDLYESGRQRMLEGDLRGAEYHLWEMLRLAPDAPTSTYVLGVCVLLQGRLDEGRRIIERAYRLRADLNDDFDTLGRDELLAEVEAAIPDWTWPRYQRLRNRFAHLHDQLVALHEHTRTVRPDHSHRLAAADASGQLESALAPHLANPGITTVSVPFRSLTLEQRIAVMEQLAQAKFAWVFDRSDVIAARQNESGGGVR